MRKALVSMFAGSVLVLLASHTALAASEKRADPGLSDLSNCFGHTVAYAAQYAQNNGHDYQPGIGGQADMEQLSVTEFLSSLACNEK